MPRLSASVPSLTPRPGFPEPVEGLFFFPPEKEGRAFDKFRQAGAVAWRRRASAFRLPFISGRGYGDAAAGGECFLAEAGGAFIRVRRFGLAVKPKDSDTFVREVDEELRRDRVTGFMTRYGYYVIGGIVLLLAAIGGWIWWQHRQNVAAGEQSEKLIQVIEQIERNNAQGAAPAIDELAGSNRQGYRIAALFARANAQISTNAIPAAVETLKTIAGDGDAPQPYRDAALIRQTQLELDNLPPGEVEQRMRPLAQAGNAWHGTAGELLAVALIRQQKLPEAGRVFEAIAKDKSVPETIRARAIQMASSLGIDAVQLDPSVAAEETTGGGAPGNQPAQAPAEPK